MRRSLRVRVLEIVACDGRLAVGSTPTGRSSRSRSTVGVCPSGHPADQPGAGLWRRNRSAHHQAFPGRRPDWFPAPAGQHSLATLILDHRRPAARQQARRGRSSFMSRSIGFGSCLRNWWPSDRGAGAQAVGASTSIDAFARCRDFPPPSASTVPEQPAGWRNRRLDTRSPDATTWQRLSASSAVAGMTVFHRQQQADHDSPGAGCRLPGVMSALSP